MMLRNRVILMLGGNLGDTRKVFDKALERIGSGIGKVTCLSRLYGTEPWGKTDQPPFLNQALVVETGLNPVQVLKQTQAIETALGKRKEELNGPRVIDIDVMFYEDRVMSLHDLTIPHPRLHLRKFNLVPLAEIVPDWEHPILKKKIRELLHECNDPLNVEPLSGN